MSFKCSFCQEVVKKPKQTIIEKRLVTYVNTKTKAASEGWEIAKEAFSCSNCRFPKPIFVGKKTVSFIPGEGGDKWS